MWMHMKRMMCDDAYESMWSMYMEMYEHKHESVWNEHMSTMCKEVINAMCKACNASHKEKVKCDKMICYMNAKSMNKCICECFAYNVR